MVKRGRGGAHGPTTMVMGRAMGRAIRPGHSSSMATRIMLLWPRTSLMQTLAFLSLALALSISVSMCESVYMPVSVSVSAGGG